MKIDFSFRIFKSSKTLFIIGSQFSHLSMILSEKMMTFLKIFLLTRWECQKIVLRIKEGGVMIYFRDYGGKYVW